MPEEAPVTPTPPRKSGLSPARRATHAAAIRRWKPWANSTGPRTPIGKAKSAQNAYKHGGRARGAKLYNQALSAQRACVRTIRAHRAVPQKYLTNKLLKRFEGRIQTLHRIFLVRLHQSLEYDELCKNLAFSPPLRQIVNANVQRTTQLHGFQQARKTNPRGGRHVGRGGFIRHGGAAARARL